MISVFEAVGQLLHSKCRRDLRQGCMRRWRFLGEVSWERCERLETTEGNEKEVSGRAQRIGKAEGRGCIKKITLEEAERVRRGLPFGRL